jgi:endonuclease/exonuclease/phosphatase family metal-dependent hydrolase
VDVLTALEPDVVGLQEIDVGRARTGAADQIAEIAAGLEMQHHFQLAVKWPDGDYGIGILSRLPVRKVEGRHLPNPKLPFVQRRVAVMAVLEHRDGEIAFVNTHLGLLRAERREQIAFLARWLGSVQMPTILCGDMNAPPHAPECRPLDEILIDAFGGELHGRTFPVHFPVSRIDQIRVSPQLESVAVAIPRNPLTRVASDHFPVVADLRIRESYRRDGRRAPRHA